MGAVIEPEDNDDAGCARRFAKPFGDFMRRWRARIERYPWLNVVYKTLITLLGSATVVIGLILVPLPGPGWLIVFIGLTILGSEYHWARRLTSWLRMQLARFWAWWRAWRAARAERRAAKQEAHERRSAPPPEGDEAER